jgi:hypothetical protein
MSNTVLEMNQLGVNIVKAQAFQIASIISSYPNENFAEEISLLINETNIRKHLSLLGDSFNNVIEILNELILDE